MTYDENTKGVCLQCEEQYLLFTKVNSCKKTNIIPNCVQFERENKCRKCDTGFVIQTVVNGLN